MLVYMGLEENVSCCGIIEKIYLTAKEICAYFEKEYGVADTAKGMTSCQHTLGFANKKPEHVPGKANRQTEAEFIEKYNKLKEDKASEERIYFTDGADAMHNSQPAYG